MEKGIFTINKTTVECYKIRHSSGMYWADINIDASGETGRIQIASDYGSFQYYWGNCGCSFKDFLSKIGLDYAASKFKQNEWFDIEKTIKGYKEYIIELRRENNIESDLARKIFDEIKSLEDCSSKDEFVSEAWNKKKLMELFDQCPSLSYGITPQFKNFWKHIWPELINQFKEEKNTVKDTSFFS